MAKAVGTKSINQIKNFYYDNKKQTGKLGGKLDQKNAANQKSKATDVTSKDEKNQKHDSIVCLGRSWAAPRAQAFPKDDPRSKTYQPNRRSVDPIGGQSSNQKKRL